MNARTLFDETARGRVRAAVATAEGATGGEIVPVVVDAADPYPEARWAGATAGAILALVAAVAFESRVGAWGASIVLWSLVPALAGAAVGWLLGGWRGLHDLLTADAVVARRVALAAEAAFLDHEVFATADRTGVLLFVALRERRVVVLGDSGIDARVESGEWETIVDALTAGLRRGEAVDALCRAVEAIGTLLARKGVARRAADANELADDLRLGGPST